MGSQSRGAVAATDIRAVEHERYEVWSRGEIIMFVRKQEVPAIQRAFECFVDSKTGTVALF